MAGSSLMTGKDASGNYRTARVGSDGGLGSATGTYQSGAGTVSGGTYSWVYAHVDTTLSSVTSADISGSLTNVTIKGGSWWRCGNATSVAVSSGEVTVYDA
jgi:hypothetical protein